MEVVISKGSREVSSGKEERDDLEGGTIDEKTLRLD